MAQKLTWFNSYKKQRKNGWAKKVRIIRTWKRAANKRRKR